MLNIYTIVSGSAHFDAQFIHIICTEVCYSSDECDVDELHYSYCIIQSCLQIGVCCQFVYLCAVCTVRYKRIAMELDIIFHISAVYNLEYNLMLPCQLDAIILLLADCCAHAALPLFYCII